MRRPWEGLKGDTFPKPLIERAEGRPGATALREKTLGVWRPYTWSDYLREVRSFAYGLLALGLKPGEHVAAVGFNRPFILFAEQAAMALHGRSVGVYPDLLPEERAYWLDYTDVSIVVAEDQEQVDKILAVKSELPKLRAVVYWDERMMWRYRVRDVALLSWDDVVKAGAEIQSTDPDLLKKLAETTSPDDVCLILSTSGTTGRPKGVMLTYGNMLSMAKNLWEVDPVREDDEYISYLPFGWIGEQMMSLAMHMLVGFRINFVEEPETLWRDFREIAPHFMFGAARGARGYVEIPMSRAAALVNMLNLSLRRDGKPLVLSGDYPFYTVYRCRGGRVALGAVEPKFWERFCRAVGREDLIPRQLDPAAREEVEKVLAGMDCGALEELARREEIPLTPVYDIDRALAIFPPEALLNGMKTRSERTR